MKRNLVSKLTFTLRALLLVALVTSQFGPSIHVFASGLKSFTLPDEITIAPSGTVHIGYALWTSMKAWGLTHAMASRSPSTISAERSSGTTSNSMDTMTSVALRAGPAPVPPWPATRPSWLSSAPPVPAQRAAPCHICMLPGCRWFHPPAPAPDLTDPASPNHFAGFFRTAWNDTVQGGSAADFAYNFLGLRKAATIQDGSPYSSSLAQVFADDFAALGGTITFRVYHRFERH